MTYLELCQRSRLDCEITGSLSTVSGQSGNLARIVNWVADSYTEIQQRTVPWRWLRHGWTVNTVADDDSYAYSDCTDTTASAAISRFKEWLIRDPNNPPKCYLQSSGVGTEYWLNYVPWEIFRGIYKIGSQTSSMPNMISIDPQNNLVLGPAPNDVYVVSGEYRRSAQVLAANGDIPEMPEDFHMLIVYRAMQKYGGFAGAQEKLYLGQTEGDRIMRQLEVDQLPELAIGGPLA